jgi:uncharacterized protein (UPF0332 family)
VTPEAAVYLDKAREFLAKAADMMADGWPDEAGRAAYLAGLHAAQAFIFERSGKIVRRHRGVQYEFYRLTAGEPRIDIELRGFLTRGYSMKTAADYATGPDALVAPDQARAAIATANRLVEAITAILGEA